VTCCPRRSTQACLCCTTRRLDPTPRSDPAWGAQGIFSAPTGHGHGQWKKQRMQKGVGAVEVGEDGCTGAQSLHGICKLAATEHRCPPSRDPMELDGVSRPACSSCSYPPARPPAALEKPRRARELHAAGEPCRTGVIGRGHAGEEEESTEEFEEDRGFAAV
jgi:hypothetical protein